MEAFLVVVDSDAAGGFTFTVDPSTLLGEKIVITRLRALEVLAEA